MSTPIITLYDVVFTTDGKRYSYLAGTLDYDIEEYVVVPVGRGEIETVAKIVAMKHCSTSELLLPVEQLKTILRRASTEEREAFNKSTLTTPKKSKEKTDKTSFAADNTYISEGIQSDGSLILCYEDYGVDAFDGMDYEVTYELNPENTKKLQEFLSAKYTGNIEYMIIQECGLGYRKKALTELFEEAGVEFSHFSWIS